MFIASEEGHLDVVKVLLEFGANFNDKTVVGDDIRIVDCLIVMFLLANG